MRIIAKSWLSWRLLMLAALSDVHAVAGNLRRCESVYYIGGAV